MRDTLEMLVRLEASREPRLQRVLDGLRMRQQARQAEHAKAQQVVLALIEHQLSLREKLGRQGPITAFELRSAGARVDRLDHDIALAQERVGQLGQQVQFAARRTARAEQRLSGCRRRQAKLERAVHRLGRAANTQREHVEHSQAEQLALIHWRQGANL